MPVELSDRIQLAAAALKAAGAREVYLFGSRTTGQGSEGSDVDLAVSGLPPERFFEAMGDAADILGCRLDLVDIDEPTPFARYLREEEELLRVG